MDDQTELDKLREELRKLREKRDELIFRLGEHAQDNQDLRENSAYLHTEQKIHVLDSQITRILDIFGKHKLAKIRTKHAVKS